ncbi:MULTISPECIES: response regulator transcription factor [Chryseobacterium]|uniref:Response regulator transcription factor n=1 Tax=Chryseobacterium candidae TaxID=1978493 RepID=A0ABY2R4D7_9FLAO|nr:MULTISPECIES: response regulator transcription factor [Chryseobacterium]PXW16188.1 LuxR family two component transcriptional regulator [Chryseobacterium sp. CBTAP 102]THV56968.1 response regulator transcription factor [Chryseobacterium candidae]SIR34763.1 two component transcriptional regulator, LuxR family [Chryseobacterium sp. RU33C]
MENNIIRVIIVDDEALFRQGISLLIQREKDIELVSDFSNGKELLDELVTLEKLPDIILMDLNMPEINGVEATKQIHIKYPQIRIIALTSYNTKAFIVNMIQSGACSFLKKNSSPAELLTAIREVHSKGFFYNNEVMEALHQNLIEPKKKVSSIFDANHISKREKEVLELICKQYNTSEIADQLFISSRTVEGHRNSLLLKTGAKNTAGLVVYAIESKIADMNYLKDRFE